MNLSFKETVNLDTLYFCTLYRAYARSESLFSHPHNRDVALTEFMQVRHMKLQACSSAVHRCSFVVSYLGTSFCINSIPSIFDGQ